ncbi:Ig-like domain-containing protein [Xanthobacter flavus]|uniref:Ig-like domain-containing protein n=1 Tax=Xanthobacter flavus TaxID=281 RepID=UPI003729E232
MAFGIGSGWWGRPKKPAFDALDASKTVQENAINSAATSLDGNVTLTNADGTGFSGGKLNVSIAGATSSDALGIAETGGITVVGSTVYYQGEQIGTVASSGNAGAPLTVQFDSGPVSNEAATALARSVTYSSSSDAPSTQFRTVTFQATDAENTVGSAKLRLKVAAENDAPVVTGLSEHVVRDLSDAGTPRSVDSDLVVTNPDGTGFKGGSLSIHLDGATSGDDITLVPGTYRIVDNKVYDGRKVVGTVTSDGQDGHDLTIQLKPGVNFTDANMTALARQVAHSTSDAAPPEGERTLSYTFKDREGDVTTKQAGLSIDYPNRPPVAQDDTRTIAEDTALVIQASSLVGNDTDLDGDSLTVTAVGEASHGTVALVNGQITFIPDADYNGPASFTYTVSDGKGGTDIATVAVNVAPVNDAPVAGDDTLSMNEDSALVIFPGAYPGISIPRPTVALPTSSVLGNDTDAEGDALTIVAVGGASHGSVELINGTLVFYPDPDYTGPASFTYTVSDGKGGTDTATVAVNVTPANDAPAAADDAVAMSEDGWLFFATPNIEFGVPAATPIELKNFEFSALLSNDSDVDGDSLSIVAVGDATHGTVYLESGTLMDGSEYRFIKFVPDPDYTGPASFSYTVSDGKGGMDTATVAVNVAPVNDAPVAGGDTVATAEDTPLVVAVADLLANDSDIDGDTLTVISVGGVGGGGTGNGGGMGGTGGSGVDGGGGSGGGGGSTVVGGSVSLDQGQITFTPAPDYTGPAAFSYTVSDGHGGIATANVTVNVTPVNDAPVITSEEACSVAENAVGTAYQIVASDVDGDALTYALSGADAHLFTVDADGRVAFKVAPDFDIPADADGDNVYDIVVEAHDGAVATTRDVTITVTDTGDNRAPVAADDTVSVREDVELVFQQQAVPDEGDGDGGRGLVLLLGDDTDPDGDPLAVTAVGDGVNGDVVLDDQGRIHFRPDDDFNGAASFSYTVSDGRGGTDTATVTVNVTPVNDAPVAVDDAIFWLSPPQAILFTGDLLANDRDVDGDSLFFAGIGNAQGGTATWSDNNVTFVFDSGVSSGSFTYTVSDGYGGWDTGHVTIENVRALPV